jgi:hypothetical protein
MQQDNKVGPERHEGTGDLAGRHSGPSRVSYIASTASAYDSRHGMDNRCINLRPQLIICQIDLAILNLHLPCRPLFQLRILQMMCLQYA